MKLKDQIWKHIIDFCKIDLNNINESNMICTITSQQIKDSRNSWTGKSNQFEPRLLCKFDTKNSRPKIFKDNNIYMISIKNGIYALIKTDIYIKLVIDEVCNPKIIRNTTNSLLLDIGNSEISMLDKLYYNNILTEIIGEEIKYGPLLGGRHYCSFNTFIGTQEIEINGSQYETDGCYETDNFACIVEAKSKKHQNFNIRQLYYPFREVHKKIGDKKQIICLFIHKEYKKKEKKDIIHIHKFKWNNYEKMLDIKNIKYYKYIL